MNEKKIIKCATKICRYYVCDCVSIRFALEVMLLLLAGRKGRNEKKKDSAKRKRIDILIET